MVLQKIFLNEYGRLRSGWRLLLFAILFIALQYFVELVVWTANGVLGSTVPSFPYRANIADIAGRVAMVATALIAGYVCTRFLEGLPWRTLGLTLHSGWLRDFLFGSAIGVLSLLVAVGVAAAAGSLRFTLTGADIRVVIAKSLIATLVLFVVAALFEEALFRGYPLQTLTRAKLAWVGVLLTSVPFAIGHLWNPNVVPGVTFANTALAGVWLAVAYLRTRSLWLPVGIHWAWNWTLGSVCGLPVSGMKLVGHPLFNGQDLGPSWLTGGSYGIEGGAACTIALLLSILFLWRTRLLSATTELLQLTSDENPATPKFATSVVRAEETI